MSGSFDAIVAGLGAMGSAAAYHLARRGARVLGLDRFAPPHARGSSHGGTRVIREAYFEHPSYVPLVQRAYELWADLERETGAGLYLKTGGLMIGRPESAVVSGAIRSAREHRLPHEILSAREIRARVPALHPDDEMQAVLEPRAGLLFPERSLEAHLRLARAAGAAIRFDEPLLEWTSGRGGVTVRTPAGEYRAKSLVLAAGAWMPSLATGLRARLQVERQVLLWFQPPDRLRCSPGQLPIHLWEYETEKMFYGFPDLGDGLKLAFHHQGEFTSADSADRELRAADVENMRVIMRRYLPEMADAELLRATVCLYTNTPDGHFILDRLPGHPGVIAASPCSGHGFKFASAIGEALADLAQERAPRCDLRLFSASRFHNPPR